MTGKAGCLAEANAPSPLSCHTAASASTTAIGLASIAVHAASAVGAIATLHESDFTRSSSAAARSALSSAISKLTVAIREKPPLKRQKACSRLAASELYGGSTANSRPVLSPCEHSPARTNLSPDGAHPMGAGTLRGHRCALLAPPRAPNPRHS